MCSISLRPRRQQQHLQPRSRPSPRRTLKPPGTMPPNSGRETETPLGRPQDQECEPIKIMEVLNEAGDYCPAATLVIKGNPLRSPLSLHYRLDYTIRIPNKRTWLARPFRRPHGRPAMRYVEGTYPEIMMATAATSGLTEIIYQEANRGLFEALEKGRIYPDDAKHQAPSASRNPTTTPAFTKFQLHHHSRSISWRSSMPDNFKRTIKDDDEQSVVITFKHVESQDGSR